MYSTMIDLKIKQDNQHFCNYLLNLHLLYKQNLFLIDPPKN